MSQLDDSKISRVVVCCSAIDTVAEDSLSIHKPNGEMETFGGSCSILSNLASSSYLVGAIVDRWF